MSAPIGVDPEKVISRLSQQVGSMAAEMAMRDTVIEAQQARIAELEQQGRTAALEGEGPAPGDGPAEGPGED